jgi:hypothetical protein
MVVEVMGMILSWGVLFDGGKKNIEVVEYSD